MKVYASLFCLFCASTIAVSVLTSCDGGSNEPTDGGSGGFCTDSCNAVLVGCTMQNTMKKCMEACAFSIADQRTYCVDLYKALSRCYMDNRSQITCDEGGYVVMPTACQPQKTAYLDTCYH